MDVITYNKATITTPDGTEHVGVRLLVRRGELRVLDNRGSVLFTTELADATKYGRNRATLKLLDGTELPVSNDCGCGANRR